MILDITIFQLKNKAFVILVSCGDCDSKFWEERWVVIGSTPFLPSQFLKIPRGPPSKEKNNIGGDMGVPRT